ncbi:MAG: stage V sporulation protein AD [Syntrophomonadaceae bacterium]|nr:stage V sporulation protein AD [Syntrophomonadaceae bacterium]
MPAAKKKGQQSLMFTNPPYITSWASLVGPKEGEGPWGADFDIVLPDYLWGEASWEKAETKMLRDAISKALSKQGLQNGDAELMLAGDLLNQIISSSYAAREINIPFLGLYGACSTMSESLLLGAIMIDGGFFERVVAATSSHHYTAERQFRSPIEQGVQRVPSSQWTATAAGAVVLQASGAGPRITCATVGRVVDLGQTDAANMGGAMAPAAVDTIVTHFRDTGRTPDYYDLIVTGDLGAVGAALARELFIKEGLLPSPNYSDCGVLLYDGLQGVDSGGSGCGCAGCMFTGPLLRKIKGGEINRLLLVATGALMSPISTFQGESIPGIAHAVAIENI